IPPAATHAPESDVTAPGGALRSAAVAPALAQDRFTTIEEEHDAARLRNEASHGGQRLTIALLSAALVGIVALALWQLIVPPSADRLHQQITAAAESDDQDLSAAAPQISRFLSLYPSDPRAEEVQSYREQLELERLERSLERRAQRMQMDESTPPAEQAYLEAMQLAQRDPYEAARRMQAVVDVFGSGEGASERTVQLAERQLVRLRQRIAAMEADHSKQLQTRLDDALAQQQRQPQAAQAVLKGIVTLYADKPWAAEIVAQARRAMVDGGGQTE
ncbi:MAG: hypothetical protein KDA41_04940, partial [Planctomycetales bacterium]|nr:hypothetical protein [Planctomycetales bacterium]